MHGYPFVTEDAGSASWFEAIVSRVYEPVRTRVDPGSPGRVSGGASRSSVGEPQDRSAVSSLPPVIRIAAIVALVVLLGLCGATAYVVLRASARERIASWSGTWVITLLVAAIVPWLVIRL